MSCRQSTIFRAIGTPSVGELLEHLHVGRPLAGLGLLAAGKPELAEEDVAELLGRADVELLAGELVDLGLDRRRLLREGAGEARKDLPVDLDAAPLHAREHRHQRPLQPLVDARDALGRQPRLQHAPDAQREVGVLRRVAGGAVDRHAVEA